MSRSHLTVAREYDLPRSIVWDALVDADLVTGWLAPAEIDPRVGGRYNLAASSSGALQQTDGVVEKMDEPALLVVGTLREKLEFRLEELKGGTRATSTLLTVVVRSKGQTRFSSTAFAHWLTNLEQLESLLRGKPVDWQNWEIDWRPVLLDYLSNKKVTKPL